MSDDELDREWKPTGRPQSTMARSFSLALNDVFKMDNSLADLDAAVEQKKRAVSSQTSELEALEARLKATEERLKQRQAMSAAAVSNRNTPNARQQMGVESSLAEHSQQRTQPMQNTTTSPPTAEPRPRTATRPVTARRPVPSYTAPPIPGALPPTPGGSDDGDFPSAQKST